MPEGPEVRTYANNLQLLLSGTVLRDVQIVAGPHQQFAKDVSKCLKPIFKDKNAFIRFRNVKCKGKFIYFELILYKLEGSEFVVKGIKFIGNHFGMTGHWRKDEGEHTMVKFAYTPYETYRKIIHGQENDQLHFIYFDDMRHFGKFYLLTSAQLTEKLNQLGPDVLSDEFTESVFQNIIHEHAVQNKMIGNVIVDQHVFSGIGNYLRADILYTAQINPRCKVKNINENQLKALYRAMKAIPLKAYQEQGTTLRTYRADMEYQEPGGYDPLIYGKKFDPLGNPVETMNLGGRTMHWVPNIQK